MSTLGLKSLLMILIIIFGCYGITFTAPFLPYSSTNTPTQQATPSFTMTHQASATHRPPATKTVTPTETVSPTPTILISYGDLHIHTICSDGKGNYEEMVEQAIKSNLSFMAITDHRMNSAVCREIHKKCRAETRLLCLPGMEVSGRVHLLAIGIQRSIDANLPLPTQVAEIHNQGGLAIAAHPFSPKWQYFPEDFQSGLDAIECPWEITTPPVDHSCIYDSDSHDVYVANMLKCFAKINSIADLKNAIEARRCTRWDLDIPVSRETPILSATKME